MACSTEAELKQKPPPQLLSLRYSTKNTGKHPSFWFSMGFGVTFRSQCVSSRLANCDCHWWFGFENYIHHPSCRPSIYVSHRFLKDLHPGICEGENQSMGSWCFIFVTCSILGPSKEADARKFHAPFQPKTPQLNRGFYTKTNLELKLSSNLTKQNQMISKHRSCFFFSLYLRLGLEKYLTLWILLAVAVGIAVGQIPGVPLA